MKSKWFWGIFFILSGGLVLINALGIFATINMLSLIVSIFLIAIMIGSLRHFNFGGILIPLALLGIIFAEELNITAVTPWPILITATLLTVGLEIITGSSKKRVNKFSSKFEEGFDEVINEADDDEVSYRVKMGAGVKYINTNNLKKCHLNCSLGAIKVYFDNAKVSKNGAVIHLNISLGAAELYIPKDWNVILEADVALGDIEEKNNHPNGNGPKVIIKGNVSLAGVEIIYI